mgnify:CR=1 FL=1
MTKKLLTYLSHNFCANCCGDAKKLDCDCRNTTCDKLANFLVSCNLYKEPIDEDELDRLAEEEFPIRVFYNRYGDAIGQDNKYKEKEAYKAGYRKAKEE